MPKTILIVDDEATDRLILAAKLKKLFDVEVLEDQGGKDCLKRFREGESAQKIDLVMLDYHMPDLDGLEILKQLKKLSPETPVILITGDTRSDLPTMAIRLGAEDFITKPADDNRLYSSIQNIRKIKALKNELQSKEHKSHFKNLIGYDTGLATSVKAAQKATKYDIPVLITGETGTGKEVFAEAIHFESKNKSAPFVGVNCGAIPKHLIESTLFGHKKGAFTGAVQDGVGCFREADGGTLFLDEIGDLPFDAQVKLLRVLQQKTVRPVGDSREYAVDVRIISATNHDLSQLVEEGKFREDLFYRLNVMNIHLPPLRERKQDIVPLAEYFIEQFSIEENSTLAVLERDTKALLENYWWPGNVRELENVIQRALVMCGDAHLRPEHFDLPSDRRKKRAPAKDAPARDFTHIPFIKQSHFSDRGGLISLHDEQGSVKSLKEIESEVCNALLTLNAGNVSRSAKQLGITRATFYKKL